MARHSAQDQRLKKKKKKRRARRTLNKELIVLIRAIMAVTKGMYLQEALQG